MRIIHTADWHLGQTLHDYERDYEHARFLEWLLEQITLRKPDALLIAGDIFDSVNPPATAHRMFFDFLDRASAVHPGLQMVVTAGNHDAAARLEAPGLLLQRFNVHVRGTVERGGDGAIDYSKFLVPLRKTSGEVGAVVLAVPYLRPSDVPQIRDAGDPYTEGIGAFYRRLTDMAVEMRDTQYPGAVLMGMGHCHLMDGAESKDSERRLVVGGLEALRCAAFPSELRYVALGHLHKPQAFDGGRVAYSGSPIPMSFTERSYEHRVWELDFDAEGIPERRSLEIPRTASLLSLPSGPAVPLNELEVILKKEDFSSAANGGPHPFLEVRCLDDGPDPTRRQRIEQALAGKPVRLVNIKFEPLARAVGAGELTEGLGDLRSVDPIEVLRASYRERYEGTEPGEELLEAFREILAEASL